jgi:hypothetical protein
LAKKQSARARSTPQPQPQQSQPSASDPRLQPGALHNIARMISLMGAVAVGLLVFELLQAPIGYWPALILGLIACIPTRAALLWLERIWLRAVARKAQRRQAANQPDAPRAKTK